MGHPVVDETMDKLEKLAKIEKLEKLTSLTVDEKQEKLEDKSDYLLLVDLMSFVDDDLLIFSKECRMELKNMEDMFW